MLPQFQDRTNLVDLPEAGQGGANMLYDKYMELRSAGMAWQALLAEAMMGIDSDLDPLKPQAPTARAPVLTFLRDEDLVESVRQVKRRV